VKISAPCLGKKGVRVGGDRAGFTCARDDLFRVGAGRRAVAAWGGGLGAGRTLARLGGGGAWRKPAERTLARVSRRRGSGRTSGERASGARESAERLGAAEFRPARARGGAEQGATSAARRSGAWSATA
jgi:hypothetical protein